MLIIDTNILAYLLIAGDRTKVADALYKRDADWRSEGFILIEFSNVLATYRRSGELTTAQTERLMRDAERLVPNVSTVSHQTALQFAEEYFVSAYDARFLAAAEQLGTRLVTEDGRLRSAAPLITQSMHDALKFN